MLDIFDPITWTLWVFLPAMRYVFLPSLIEWHIKSYIVLIPAFTLICVGLQFGYATERIYETLLGGLILVIMLGLDLKRMHIQLCCTEFALSKANTK